MTKKAKAAASKANTLKVQAEPGQSHEAVMAKLAVTPTMTAATVCKAFSQTFGEVDLGETSVALLDQTKRVHDGNLRELESTLTAQAAALNCIFTELARRAAINAGEYMNAAELYLKLALRAQNQCRMTLETLATIKNPPPVAFVRQANIAHGPQQVNNGEPHVPPARAEQTANGPTGLLESPHAKPQWMDAAAPGTAGGADTELATVAAIDRPKDAARQGDL
ncbi:MAG: hypothetical protein JSS21_12045 [Proteobacteria bacterium]|nr:hypothetical protein [Pseudomonadota bacterium]